LTEKATFGVLLSKVWSLRSKKADSRGSPIVSCCPTCLQFCYNCSIGNSDLDSMSFISVSDSVSSAMQPIQPNSISYPIQRKSLKRKRQNHYWDNPPRKNPHKKLKYPRPADPDYVWVSGEVDQYKSRCTYMYLREALKKYRICPCEVFPFYRPQRS